MPAVAEAALRADDFDPSQPRNEEGKWSTTGYHATSSAAIATGDIKPGLCLAYEKHHATGYLLGAEGRLHTVKVSDKAKIASQSKLREIAKSIDRKSDYAFEEADDDAVMAALSEAGFDAFEYDDVGPDNKYQHETLRILNPKIAKVTKVTEVDEDGDEIEDSRNDAAKAFETPGADLTDHQVAEGMRDGKFSSPQKYGDFWLFDVRVTGTGMAFREALGEWAHRDPELWTSDEFLERAASVPVIFGHPDGRGLNSDEYRERSIGNMVLSYRKDDEVWGVAKIFDADAALAMQTTHRSTSPGVTPPQGSTPILLESSEDGSAATKVLDEGLPLILDHLAVCEAGVWDKDGPPDGIRLDALTRKDAPVTEAEKAALEKERDDAAKRADAAEKELDDMKKADAARKDADESDKEAIEKAEKEKADKAKKDAAMEMDAKKDARKDRHSKHDGDIMDCAKCDSEESEEAKKDAAGAPKEPVDADRGNEIHDSKTVAELKRLVERQGQQLAALTAPPSISDANEIAGSWAKWDPLYQALNDHAPIAYPGEKPRAYLRRLADGVRKYTASFQNYVFHDAQQATDFGLVSDAIFAEAVAHSKKPSVDSPGILRPIVTHPHGKTRTEFRGDHKAAWLPFTHPNRTAIVSINRPTGNVYQNH